MNVMGRGPSPWSCISTPPTAVPDASVTTVYIVVVEFHKLQKKDESLQRSKPGCNVKKEMYGPFPPRGDVRPTKSERILCLCNKEPTKKRNIPEVSSMAQHP